MGRTYEPKVKMYTDFTIEKAVEEVARGAKAAPTVRKYHMITSILGRRVRESQGLMTRGKQVVFQSKVFMTVYKMLFSKYVKFMRIYSGIVFDF